MGGILMPFTQNINGRFVVGRQLRTVVAGVCLIAGLAATDARSDQAAAQAKPDAAAKPPSWVRVVEKAPFPPRDTAEDAVFHGRMWLSNGYVNGGKLVRDLWSSVDGIDWELMTDHTPYDGYSEMAVYDGKLWAVKASVWNSSDGVTWKLVSPKTPFGARGYGELVVFRNRIWQLGSGDDVWNTRDGVQWERVTADAPFGARSGSAVTVYKDRLWLMGGATSQASRPPEKHYPKFTTYNDVWSSADGATWTRLLDHAPWAERMWFVAKVYAGKLWILGGFSNRRSVNFAEAWYSEDGKTWREYKSSPMFSPRHEVAPYVFHGSLWVVGGNSWPLMNDVWRLTLPGGQEKGKR
jgi:hypothetical protein